jgi:ubiquinone/menaquinone biosynthesis C-methylase UbiE
MNIKQLPQPLGFFHIITDDDALHYGYWPEGKDELSLAQAQHEHNKLLLSYFPSPPCKVLDVGCGLGLTAGELHKKGYQVTAIAPSGSLIAYAEEKHPGPDYINCGFLDDNAKLQEQLQEQCYDVILFQESLQYFPDLPLIFQKAKHLLQENGRIILCDEVSYNESTRSRSAVHLARVIEQSFLEQGLYSQHHQLMGQQVTPTCDHVLQGFENKQQEMLTAFGLEVAGQIEHTIAEWHNLQNWYKKQILGYEMWDLRSSQLLIKGYQPNNEQAIVEQFNRIFGQNRTLNHWRWKYSENPFGGPTVSMAWDNAQLASHYSAYPLPLSVFGHQTTTFHVGDTFTLPEYRGVGRGKTNLLSRVVRHFHKSWCEGKIDFFYGFNTGRIQKLGKSFLSYVPVAPVYEYTYSASQMELNKISKLKRLVKGYRIELAEHCGDWADTLFERVKNDFPMLISRTREYLQWRYDRHPDYSYQYVLLKRWGKVIGWWVIRYYEDKLLLVDALFPKQYRKQGVQTIVEVLSSRPELTEMLGWFAATPEWWTQQLLEIGFEKQRQAQQLDLCATFFSDRCNKGDISNNFYFTMGDSDLY